MTADAPVPVAGREWAITAGGYRACITETGATLRSLELDGTPLIDDFAAGDLPPAGHGQILAPWPNRLRDGIWTWQGRPLRLPVDEPALGNSASHGLVRWAAWQVLDEGPAHVVLTHRLAARPGYPFPLDLECRYRLSAANGLAASVQARNAGTEPAPVALGVHPYLRPLGRLDDAVLTIPADQFIRTDDTRMPVGVDPVSGADDLRHGRLLAARALNHTFGGLRRHHGSVLCQLSEPTRTLELWAGETCRWLQVYTGDALDATRRRRAVAVEPMTAPPQALATGVDLAVLAPGHDLALEWGLRVR